MTMWVKFDGLCCDCRYGKLPFSVHFLRDPRHSGAVTGLGHYSVIFPWSLGHSTVFVTGEQQSVPESGCCGWLLGLSAHCVIWVRHALSV